MKKNIIEWFGDDDLPIPDVRMKRFSVCVLACFEGVEERSVGWFDYQLWKWMFLCDEDLNKQNFKWRYFTEKFDSAEF
jgi:hypothetical protein